MIKFEYMQLYAMDDVSRQHFLNKRIVAESTILENQSFTPAVSDITSQGRIYNF